MQSSIPATFFAVTFGLLLHPISTGSHHGSTQRHLQQRLEDVFRRFSPLVTSHATLTHNDNCISPYEEKLRQEIVEELHKIATRHATLGLLKDVIEKMEEFISMNDKELCNYRLFLACDPELRKCVCGPTRVNVSYVWEEDICRYAEGSMCPSSSKIQCSQDTRCISMNSFEECTGELCYCQKEYYPVTTAAPVVTTAKLVTNAPIVVPPEEDDFEDGEDDNNVSNGDENDTDNEVIPSHTHPKQHGHDVIPASPTIESLDEGSSSEEEPVMEGVDDDDDDDIGDGERDQIIVVRLGEMEKSGESVGTTVLPLPPGQEEEYRHVRSTTVPTPVGTSPVPTRRQELTSAIRRLEREVELTKSLGFGDECYSLNEESNYAEYRRLVNDMDCVTGENDEENLIEILGKLETILEGGNMMCNTTLHLQCDSQSKRCNCRTSSEELDGFYLLFTQEGKRCVLVDNSRCLSKEYLVSRKWPVTEIPCASDSKCIAQETKAVCKSKMENCFCRKPSTTPKPADASKQKKRAKKPSSSGTKTKPGYLMIGTFKGYFQVAVFIGMIVYLMLLPRLVLVI